MKLSRSITLLIIAQLVLLVIEFFTTYDTTVRQYALIVTNVVTTLALVFVDRWLRRKGTGLSWLTLILVAGAVWLDAAGNFRHFYAGYWWWDRVTHTIGGMALSAAFIDLFQALRTTGMQASWSVAVWLGVLVGQALGSLYEISEWLGDFWFATERVRGPYDTSHDLFQNLIGGVFVLLLMYLARRRKPATV